jgi:hypothetical protein
MPEVTTLAAYVIKFAGDLDVGELNDDQKTEIQRIDSVHALVSYLKRFLAAHSPELLREAFVFFIKTVLSQDISRLSGRDEWNGWRTDNHTRVVCDLLNVGARLYGGREQSGYRFFVALLAWDAVLTDLRYALSSARLRNIRTNIRPRLLSAPYILLDAAAV